MHDYAPPSPSSFHFSISLGAIIKLPVNPGQDISYEHLVCTAEDEEIIKELVTSIADNSKVTLLLKQNYFKSLGSQINHVHPLKFLSVSLSTPHLKSCLAVIFDDYFKRNGFMDGLGASLTRETEKGKIEKHFHPFAREINMPVAKIKPFFQNQDWEDWFVV